MGERCDGETDDDEEDEEEEDSSSQSSRSSRSSRSDTTKRSRRKGQVRRRIRGAREREVYGRLERAELECQDDLVCVEVSDDRMECQAEDPNGNLFS